jgi:hypothetical protein
MRLLVAAVVLVGGGLWAASALGDLTQARGDRVVDGSYSEVVLQVSSRGYKHDLDHGVHHLLAACAGTTFMRVVDDPGVVEIAPGTYRFTVEPALGTYNQRRLVGCLQDLTIDRLLGDVVSVEHVLPPGADGD